MRRARPGRLLVPAALALALGAAAYLCLGVGLGDADRGVALAVGLLAAFPGLRDLTGDDRRPGLLPEMLQRADDPVALCRLGGQVLSCSAAFGSDSERAEDVAALLTRQIECDDALLYRLSRSAAHIGFALEQVRDVESGRPCFLSVVRAGDDLMIWRVLSGRRVRQAVLPSVSDQYEAAPFAFCRRSGQDEIESNMRFRELFGQDAAGVLAQLSAEEGQLNSGRFGLLCSDGTDRMFRVFVPGAPVQSDAPCEVFFFDLSVEIAGGAGGHDVDDLPIAVLHLSASGRITWLNAAAGRLLGGRANPGDSLAAHLACRGRRLELLFDAVLGGTEPMAETVFAVGDGSERALQLTLAPARSQGGRGIAAVIADATELQTLQDKYAQSQKMEAVGKLAGGVAHDFNNLITAINGHCDLLLLGKDATQPEYSDLLQIRQNANRAAALVRQLLAFSRKQTLNPELLAISDVISDTLYLLDRLIGDRVKLRLDPAPGGPVGHVRADQRQLEQALMNLVVNARDAMPKGGEVTISTRRRLFRVDEIREAGVVPAGDYVEIAVADEGTGIPEDTINRVFDPFFTTKAQGEGTGLGLSTVYGIVKQSDGLIFAENRPEGGACFRVLLPRVEASTPAEPSKPALGAAAVDLTGHGAVLLVEDEAAVRSFAARALRLRGYDVVIAEEAEEALGILHQSDKHFDLIVSDVMMPGMDGPAFVARARELRPDVRVLFVSGYAEEAFRKQIDNPDYHFLPKPFSLSELTAKVKEVLGRPDAA
ncbi:MAG: ATP-binding protein [Pseudomonadota bacterium]